VSPHNHQDLFQKNPYQCQLRRIFLYRYLLRVDELCAHKVFDLFEQIHFYASNEAMFNTLNMN